MTTPSLAPIPSPLAVPPRVGLIASLSGDFLPVDEAVVVDGHVSRWATGYSYNPEQQCNQGGVSDPCGTTSKTIPSNPSNVQVQPFQVWTGDKCTTFGWSARDFKGRATRALLACESKQIAAEFWKGTLASAQGWPNRYLASPLSDTLSSPGTPLSVNNALACLEQGLADCGCGARGMIHCTRELATAWNLGGALRKENGLILTINDTIVVPDAGYDGSGPYGQPALAGSQWAYATSMITVRRSQIVVFPDTLGEATVRGTNDIEWRAERMAGVDFSTCCHLAIEVDLPKCLVGGAS